MDFIDRIKERIGLKTKPTMIMREPPKFVKGKVIKDDDYTFHMRYAKAKGNLGCNSLTTGRIQIFLPLFAVAFKSPRRIRRGIIQCVVHEMIHREISVAINRKSVIVNNEREVDHAFFEERLVRDLCGQPTISVLQFVKSAIHLKPMPNGTKVNEQ